jgi:hypothetical protein
VKQIRITKRRPSASGAPEPLPLDPRDPDIVRAKHIARRSPLPRAAALLLTPREERTDGTGR